MADLLPDIPADLWQSWSADQFAQAAQEKIASLPGDISQGVQNILPPPSLNSPPVEAMPALGAPVPDAVPAPEPPPPPPPPLDLPLPPPEPAPAPDLQPSSPPLPSPEPAPDLSAAPDITPAPADTPTPTPDLSTPTPTPTPSPAPTPTPTPTPATAGVSTSSSSFDPFGAALGAAEAAGADVGQFAQHFGQMLSQSGGDAMLAGINAASMAGGDAQQFMSNYSDAFAKAPQQIAAAADQVGQTANQVGQTVQSGAQQALSTAAGAIDSSSRQAFAKSFAPYAQYAADQLGVDPTWIAAMAGSESNFGKAPGNELFGIKALPGQKSQSLGTHEGEYGGVNMNQDFAAYDSPLESVNAYINLIKNHYPGAVGAQDLGTFVHGLKQGGYFTAAEGEYKGILQDISGQLAPAMQGATSAVQGAATTGVQAVNTAGQAAQSAVARTSQFALGLSSGDAMAFCGPAAAMAFAETFGRNPTVEEAKSLASQVGWNAGQGMAGPSSEVALLNKLGIDTHMTQGVDWGQVAKDAASGNPVIIDTPGHYFYVDGYHSDTGQFHFGSSATDLKAAKGQEWFTPDQMNSLGMGSARAAIFADHPLSGAGVALQQGVSSAWNAATDFTGQAGQRAQDTMSAVLNTGAQAAQDLTSNPAADWLDSQRSKLSDSLQSAGQTVGGLASTAQDALSGAGTSVQDLLRGGQTPTDQADADARWAAAQAAAQQQTGSSVDLSSNPLDMLSNMSQYGVGQAGQQLTDLRNQLIAQNNPLRDVPLLGGASTLLAQSTIGDPTNLLLGAGPELGLTTAGVGRDALTMLSDPAVQAALRYRQVGSAEVNAALGGIPAALGIGGEEHAGNAAQAVYNAALQSNLAPATGAGQLARAMDALGAYPEEVAEPIRQFASATDAPASELANTIQRWIQSNPLESVPNPITGPSAAAREVGQQAVSDIADEVMSRVRGGGGGSGGTVLPSSGGAGYLPQGTMPGQLGLLPDQAYQHLLPQAGESGGGLLDQLSQQIDQATAAGNAADAAKIQRIKDMLAPLYGDRTSTLDVGGQGVVPGFEQEMVNQGPQLGMTPTQGGKGGLLEELLNNLEPGEQGSPYQPQQTLGTHQTAFGRPATGSTGGLLEDLLNNLEPGQRTYTPGMPTSSGSSIEDFLQSIYGDPSAGPSLPKGVTPDMAAAAHARIDDIGNLAGTPHTDLNNMLASGANPAQIERFFGGLEGRTGTSFSDLLRQWRTGSMAGGLNTEAKVALGPVIQTAMRAPTGAIKLMLQGRASDIPDGLVGGLAGLGAGAQEALQTLRYGTNYRNALTGHAGGGFGFSPGLDVMGTNGFQRALGTALTGLVRTHGAVGDISAGIGRGANLALGATPEAAQEAGQQWALRSGEYGTTGAGIARAIGAVRKANPALDVLGQIALPFYRVGYNVFTQGVEHSPVGLLGRVTDAMQGKPLDQGKLVNNLFGVGLATLAYTQAAQGNITGEAPPPGAPKQSVRLPAVGWVPLRTLGAASEPLAQAAALYEASRDHKGDIAGMATQLATSYVAHVNDETWLSSVGDVFNTIKDVANYSSPTAGPLAQRDLGYLATSYGKSLIPQEKLAEQLMGAPKALAALQARGAPPPPRETSTVRPAPTVRPASTVRPAPTPRPAPATR